MVWRLKVYGVLHDAIDGQVGDGGGVSEAPRHLHVDLEFEVGSDPIRGRLGPNPLATREFQGWIELAAALEAVIAAPPPREARDGLRSVGGA